MQEVEYLTISIAGVQHTIIYEMVSNMQHKLKLYIINLLSVCWCNKINETDQVI